MKGLLPVIRSLEGSAPPLGRCRIEGDTQVVFGTSSVQRSGRADPRDFFHVTLWWLCVDVVDQIHVQVRSTRPQRVPDPDHSFVARIATTATSSLVFTGLARQNWNPARSTSARSWAAARPVTKAAGVRPP